MIIKQQVKNYTRVITPFEQCTKYKYVVNETTLKHKTPGHLCQIKIDQFQILIKFGWWRGAC